MMMKITNDSIKLVKPYTPTPPTNSKFNISMFDEQIPNGKIHLILYYSPSKNTPNNNHENIFDHLETSLSQALTDFYMFAGRYVRHESYIDCSDQGARYVQAKANFQLSEFLGLKWELKVSMLNDFLPLEMGVEIVEADDPMLYVKVTAFECGGFAIGVSCTHKVSDMITMSTFISNWACRSQGVLDQLGKYSPNFCFSNDFPKRALIDQTPIISSPTLSDMKSKVQVFSFKEKTISTIREKLIFKDNKRPSKVQIIVSLLWKAMVGIDKANVDSSEPMIYVASQGVNLRNKVVPKFPDNSCGNFIGGVKAQVNDDEVENMNLQGFYNALHDSIKEMESNYGKLVPLEYESLVVPFFEVILFAIRKDVKFYAFMSWCRFSFHNADFGWGKPVWRSLGNIPSERYVVLMDDEDGDGIEAWVHLDETTMHQLEQDPDIKAYAF